MLLMDRLRGALGAHFAARGVAAVEAHEGVGQSIIELSFYLGFPHGGGD